MFDTDYMAWLDDLTNQAKELKNNKMSHTNQELTHHINNHNNYTENCDYCKAIEIKKQQESIQDMIDLFAETVEFENKTRDNLFSANHRNNMMYKYGYTIAQSIKIQDL